MVLLLLACQGPGGLVIDPLEAEPEVLQDSGDTGEVTEEAAADNALSRAITTEGLMRHVEAFQGIADQTNETRAWTTGGHLDSADYVVQQLEAAGYEVEEQVFTVEDQDWTLRSVVLGDEELRADQDFSVFDGSGAGLAEGPVVPVDLELPPGASENSSTSGCQAADFQDFPAGAVALIQRGSCSFGDKARNAQEAGASAVLIFNEGQPGRRDVVSGTLGGQAGIPVLGLAFARGAELAEQQPTARIELASELVVYELVDIVAETPGGSADSVILVGAHLDSVLAGPGINDNGSGSALVLELALQLAALGLDGGQRVRFAWWDGEEYGLLGSQAYGESLAPEQVQALEAYLNFDMVGSPNGLPFLYDGDGTNTGLDYGGKQAPAGSAALEHLQQTWFESRALPYSEVSVDIPSDSYWFLYAGIPIAGSFSGANTAKSEREAALFGGEAGLAHDACYHQRCDDLDNLDAELFTTLGRSAAWTLGELLEVQD